MYLFHGIKGYQICNDIYFKCKHKIMQVLIQNVQFVDDSINKYMWFNRSNNGHLIQKPKLFLLSQTPINSIIQILYGPANAINTNHETYCHGY